MKSMVIRTLIQMVDDRELVLPAMQRPFVWQEERILRLMDSLMRLFPLGSLLVWDTEEAQRYRPFTKDVFTGDKAIINFPTADGQRRLKYVLDGQQRLTSMYIALRGSLDHRRAYLDVLSGSSDHKDPGDMYYDFRFLAGTEVTQLNAEVDEHGQVKHRFILFEDLASIDPTRALNYAFTLASELSLDEARRTRLMDTVNRAAAVVRSEKPLQVIVIDEYGQTHTPIEEILEVFVRVNSGGLVLQKSDLLMSLLDLSWNDVQPALLKVAHEASALSPVPIDRDMVLKSTLLLIGEDSRFDRLVSDRDRVRDIAPRLEGALELLGPAWNRLAVLLRDRCRIYSPRFFRRATNTLLPFVVHLARNPEPNQAENKRLVTGLYIALMGGVFSGAEARMGSFTRRHCHGQGPFPLEALARETAYHRPITTLEQLLNAHVDLALNIAHGGITVDGNPDALERDHIFPKARLRDAGVSEEQINHYANFHFLRGKDNRNKTDKPPHKWFAEPGGDAPAYTEQDMAERLLSWDLVQEGMFPTLIEERSSRIREAALRLFDLPAAEFDALFGGA
ncbi:MAG: DUF262 domain-containing protein [Deltaproteobacteria bacterium]|nr:MAG: DUF262 domain-containing protein [Deltaproteobacteria bacterium]